MKVYIVPKDQPLGSCHGHRGIGNPCKQHDADSNLREQGPEGQLVRASDIFVGPFTPEQIARQRARQKESQ